MKESKRDRYRARCREKGIYIESRYSERDIESE